MTKDSARLGDGDEGEVDRKPVVMVLVALLVVLSGCSASMGLGPDTKTVPEDYVDPDNWRVTGEITRYGPLESINVTKQSARNSSDYVIVELLFRNDTAAAKVDRGEIIYPNEYTVTQTNLSANRTLSAGLDYHRGTYTMRFWTGDELVSEVKVHMECVDKCSPEPLPKEDDK